MSSNEISRITLIAGLGNPGKQYENTRHNAGFSVVDKLLEVLPGDFRKNEAFSSTYWKGHAAGGNIFIQKPMTYMNLSGKAVASLMNYYKISHQELLLVYDDIDLPLGKLRIRKGGSSGGHNGVESVTQETGSSDFARLRIGVGRADARTQVDYVLSGFAADEQKLFGKVLEKAVDAVRLILSRGLQKAMNEFNGVSVTLDECASEKEIKTKQNSMEE